MQKLQDYNTWKESIYKSMTPQHEEQSFIVVLFRVDSFSSKKFTKENDSS